jgi:ligand-binding sensor domain-containing protein
MPYPSPGPDYVVERVTALPQVTIRAITQTRDGYLWIGTYNGLIRFDGVRAITFDLANTPGPMVFTSCTRTDWAIFGLGRMMAA